MGRPKVKIIDDSQVEEVKLKKKAKKATEVKSDETSRLSEEGEEDQSVQALTSTTSSEPVPPKAGSELEKQVQPSERSSKPQKPPKTKPRSKKYQELVKNLDRNKAYSLSEAIEMVKKLSYSKFNGTLEAHINTIQTGIRGLVSLPFATGRKLHILVFGPANLQLEGITVGDDGTIDQISKGKVDFDLIITTPAWMMKLSKVARILGPKGLMPNPKNGTITEDIKKGVEGFQAGKTEYRTESKAPVIHLALGKLNQPMEELSANIKTLIQTIGKSKVKKMSLSPTMGASVKVDLASI